MTRVAWPSYIFYTNGFIIKSNNTNTTQRQAPLNAQRMHDAPLSKDAAKPVSRVVVVVAVVIFVVVVVSLNAAHAWALARRRLQLVESRHGL